MLKTNILYFSMSINKKDLNYLFLIIQKMELCGTLCMLFLLVISVIIVIITTLDFVDVSGCNQDREIKYCNDLFITIIFFSVLSFIFFILCCLCNLLDCIAKAFK